MMIVIRQKVETLGFPSQLSNDSAESAKLCPFLKIQLEKFPQHNYFGQRNKLTVWLCSTPHTSLSIPLMGH